MHQENTPSGQELYELASLQGFFTPEGRQTLEEAIELNHTGAMIKRAELHLFFGNLQAINLAIALFDRAAQAGDPEGLTRWASLHIRGNRHNPEHYLKAIDYLDRAIAKGYKIAMSHRAAMHRYGQGGEINYSEAIWLYELGSDLRSSFMTTMDERLNVGSVYAVRQNQAKDVFNEEKQEIAFSLFNRILNEPVARASYSNTFVFILSFAKEKILAKLQTNPQFELLKSANIHRNLLGAIFASDDDVNICQYINDSLTRICQERYYFFSKVKNGKDKLPAENIGDILKELPEVLTAKVYHILHNQDTAATHSQIIDFKTPAT
ncbi:MAG: hypothetical protein K0U37_01520 [Gammaproteobacteria bacterium]|nr:hypothetical protein [Gammaproteobacteria bacterium]